MAQAQLQHTMSTQADLRGNIKGGPKLVVQAPVSGAEVSSAKVDDLDGGVTLPTGQHDVLGFQVSVHEALAVHDGKELDEAAHQFSSLLLTVVLLWAQQLFVDGGRQGCG